MGCYCIAVHLGYLTLLGSIPQFIIMCLQVGCANHPVHLSGAVGSLMEHITEITRAFACCRRLLAAAGAASSKGSFVCAWDLAFCRQEKVTFHYIKVLQFANLLLLTWRGTTCNTLCGFVKCDTPDL